MCRLFVDVDDTLVKWCPQGCEHTIHPYGAQADFFTWNDNVVLVILDWLVADREVIIWSGGGKGYAEGWRDRTFLPELARVIRAEAKWAIIPLPGDVFIDDSPFECFASHTIHPKDVSWEEMVAQFKSPL